MYVYLQMTMGHLLIRKTIRNIKQSTSAMNYWKCYTAVSYVHAVRYLLLCVTCQRRQSLASKYGICVSQVIMNKMVKQKMLILCHATVRSIKNVL